MLVQRLRTAPAGVACPKMAQIRMITVTFQSMVNSSWKVISITVDLNLKNYKRYIRYRLKS